MISSSVSVKRIFWTGLFLMVLFVTAIVSSADVFAQARVSGCTGEITGMTASGNVNAGRTSFDAHRNASGGNEGVVDVSIAQGAVVEGVSNGLAPADFDHAACSEEQAGTFGGTAYDYALKGWAWNTNLGFLSFNCQSRYNDAGAGVGVDCGDIDYGVYLSEPDGSGNRDLIGYAWSPSFGWLQFNGTGTADGEDFNYGVTRGPDGTLSGYAWTSAGVWTSFSGARIYLPGETPIVVDGGSCDGSPWVCINIQIDDAEVQIADGVEGYYVDLYLRDSDGVSPLSDADFSNLDEFLDSLNFVWEDTVKLNQLPSESGPANAVGNDLDDLRNPWDEGQGAVTFKPMNFADFEPVAGDPGHYRSIERVASYAPTGGSNVSYTTATDPVYSVNNERPVYENLTARLEANRLVLSRLEFEALLDLSGDPVFTPVPVYPNGQVDLPLEFGPAVFVDDLYVADFQDQIVGYRGVTETVDVNTEFAGSLPAVVRSSAQVELDLAYSQEETRSQCGLTVDDPVFDYNFVGDDNSLSFTVDELLAGRTLQILATLPVAPEGEEVTLPCAVAEAPRLTTTVSYNYEGNEVEYLSNHIPRIAQEGIYNPAVVIHGTVLSQLVGDVQAGKSIDTSGYVNVNKVRDTVDENLEKYLESVNSRTGENCNVIGFKEPVSGPAAIISNSAVCRTQNYRIFKVGTENVFYTKDNDITLDLTTIEGSSWVVISDGGNIFIDGDLYDFSADSLALVAFRDEDNYLATGNVYINPDVLNIQATIVSDGTVFSYNGNHADINASGEPIWASHADMMNTNSNQLKCDCAIFSRNTIGGADTDQGNNPKNYLLLGGGEVIELPVDLNERMRAQQYDLNYLRTFRTVIETNAAGLPIDQSCLRPLTPADVVAIANGDTLYGDRGDYVCDGINPLRRYNPTNISGMAAGPDGDLVAPNDIEGLAQGLNNTGTDATDFDPVYVFYTVPQRNSFLFSKAGTLSIN